ncbi:mitochondrial import receptor, Tom5 subunit [Emericellopsis atlantica]|uniref:Mitochondrial import receptor, Tom5 subunit n=2 Tax=Bionectriaceae TaxID=103887 RepID=A0A9P7ZVA7_9HYPO|nr:mitochondrial import receptor, Tom5 subunit [Emericellopsis atlantica]KAG9259009.1 mitochondrial import receptor, Tom5 subunit [Emericellopsis atlantica]
MYVMSKPNEERKDINTDHTSVAPPQQSREEIQAMEAEAVFTVQQVAATAFLLYMSPFAIDMVSKIF